jgi:hypothetical protein
LVYYVIIVGNIRIRILLLSDNSHVGTHRHNGTISSSYLPVAALLWRTSMVWPRVLILIVNSMVLFFINCSVIFSTTWLPRLAITFYCSVLNCNNIFCRPLISHNRHWRSRYQRRCQRPKIVLSNVRSRPQSIVGRFLITSRFHTAEFWRSS